MKQYVIPSEYSHYEYSCNWIIGKEQKSLKDIVCFLLGKCDFEVIGSGIILKNAELIPVKRSDDNRDIWEFLIIEVYEN